MRNKIVMILMTIAGGFISAQAQNTALQKKANLFVLGVIDSINSTQLNEKRILNIYLPVGYNSADTIKYPVIYLLDGSADEDFIHIVGLVQFNSFPWVNRIPESIVVGIASMDRRKDFTFPTNIKSEKMVYPTTGHSERFIAFLENELQPFIEEKFKVNNSKTIIGESLGGLLATEILFKKPTLFNRYIIVSPSIWWDNGSILDQPTTLLKNVNLKTKIYIGVGKEGLTPTLIPRVMEVDANVLAAKITELKNSNLDVYFDYLPDENHGTILHQSVSNAFKLLHQK